MKKYVPFIVVLLVLITGGVIWFFVANDTKESQLPKDEQTNDTQKVELTDEELTTYLSYVPSDFLIDEENNVYAKPKKNSDFDKKALLGATINYASKYTKLGKHSTEDMTAVTYDKNEIDKLIKKLYNVSANDLTEGEYGCTKIELKNNEYVQTGGCGSGAVEKLLSNIDKYEAKDDTLTIYEYKVYYKAFIDSTNEEAVSIKDMFTKKEVDLLNRCKDSTDYESKEKCAQDYFDKNKQEFTKYKHTFKKGNDDYYWVETEKA